MKRWLSSGIRTAAPYLAAVAMLFGNIQANAADLLMFETQGCAWCAAWHREVGPGYAKSSEGLRAPLRRVDLADAAKTDVAFAAPFLHLQRLFLSIRDARLVGLPAIQVRIFSGAFLLSL